MNKTANEEQFLQKIKLLGNILESRMVWIHMSFRPREKQSKKQFIPEWKIQRREREKKEKKQKSMILIAARI